MNILAIADRQPERSLLQITQSEKIDLIVTLGDLDYFMLRDLERIQDIPKIGVYGNHDSGNYFSELGIQDMHLKTWQYQGLTFGGLQGCVRYKENPLAPMYTQEEVSQMLLNFPRVDVFLAHCPPYGINDEPEDLSHQGFLGLREYVELQQPGVLLHGHTYPEAGHIIENFQQTRIVYVFREQIVAI